MHMFYLILSAISFAILVVIVAIVVATYLLRLLVHWESSRGLKKDLPSPEGSLQKSAHHKGEVDDETRQKICRAIETGRVEFTPRCDRAIENLDLRNPDSALTMVNVLFWGPSADIHADGGGIGIDWETVSAGCGRCDLYIRDGKLHCMNEAMDRKFVLGLFEHILERTVFGDD